MRFLEAHRIAPGIFSISGRLHPISVRDQILRAKQFVRRALACGLLSPGNPSDFDDPSIGKFIVVGGGAAGVTATIDAAVQGVPVILVERMKDVLTRQALCTTRLLDPTLYDWPLGHWSLGQFQWHPDLCDSALPWPRSEYANILSARWRQRFEWLRNNSLRDFIRFFPEREVRGVAAPPGAGLIQVPLTDTATGNVASTEPATVVLFTIGFGEERCSITPGHPVRCRPFWSPDNLSDHDFGIGKPAPRILICGGGDGALQDFLRVIVRPEFPTAGAILEHLFRENGDWSPFAQGLFKRFQDHLDCADRKLQWDGILEHDHWVLAFLQRRFGEAVNEILIRLASDADLESRFRTLLRDPLPVPYLVYWCDHFDRSYGLNRFLAALLAEYITKYHPRDPGDLPLLNPNAIVSDIWPVDPLHSDSYGDPHHFEVKRSISCFDRTPGPVVGSGIADIVLVRFGPDYSRIPPGIQRMLDPPRARQLLPYNFVHW